MFSKEKVYNKLIQLIWITIVLCNILKLLGCKEFEIPIFNIDIHLSIRITVNCCLFTINSLCFTMLLIKRKLSFKEIIINIISITPVFFLSLNDDLLIVKFVFEIIISCLLGCYFSKDKTYKILIETIIIYIILFIYQLLTSLYKNVNLITMPFTVETILQIDYYCLLVLTILREFKKGEYIYERWKTFILILSKRKHIEKSLQQNQENVQEVEQELGYKIFIVMLSITQLAIVGTACYFINGVLIEFIIIFISFAFMRPIYGNSYHADKILKCTTLALLVFLIATRIPLPLWLSVFCNILIGCLVAYIMHIMYYYIKYTKKGITLRLGMSKEDLLNLCSDAGISDLNLNRMILRYVEKKSIKEIAELEFVDTYTITQSLYRSRKKLKKS